MCVGGATLGGLQTNSRFVRLARGISLEPNPRITEHDAFEDEEDESDDDDRSPNQEETADDNTDDLDPIENIMSLFVVVAC